MTTFFHIGQRVKLARPRLQQYLGITGTITGFDSFPKGTWTPQGTLDVDVNCVVVWDTLEGEYLQHTDQLEPILPDGLESPEEIKELYTPDEEELCYVNS